MIKLKNQDDSTVNTVFGALNDFIRAKQIQASIWDYRDYASSISNSQTLTDTIFSAITIIVMILCFFSLISSMTANM